ncbi:MAG: hypothetical protein LBM77_03590 [Spirochaetaceae bacterium]|jgi:photosystem II stability/assembly factor-like uncharacterized protein|nr:hypothetical protein [Spirochaetaceae bacterium]
MKNKLIAILLLTHVICGISFAETAGTPGFNLSEPEELRIFLEPFAITDIVYGEDRFVAVDRSEKLPAYSTDGMNWHTIKTSASYKHGPWNAVAYGDGTFLAVGATTSAYSTDKGLSWNGVSLYKIFVVYNDGEVYDVTYGDGTFVAVGMHGKSAYSTDGKTWTEGNSISVVGDTSLFRIVYTGRRFVAVSKNGKSIYSEDSGKTWISGGDTGVTVDEGVMFNGGVAYGDGKIVVGGSNGLNMSEDHGATWQAKPTTGSTIYDILYANNMFIATHSQRSFYTSRDGITWKNNNQPRQVDGLNKKYYNYFSINAICYGNNVYVAGGQSGWSAISDNTLNNWQANDLGIQMANKIGPNAIAYGNGYFVTVGDEWSIAHSDDKNHWTEKMDFYMGRYGTSKIVYDGTHFIACGRADSSGIFAYSPDGITWTEVTEPSFYDSIEVLITVNNRTYAFGGWHHIAYTEDNGLTWTTLDTLADTVDESVWDVVRSAVYSNGYFIVLNGNGSIDYSNDDCKTWKKVETKTALTNLIYGNGCVIGYVTGRRYGSMRDSLEPVNGTMVYSNDNGLTWKKIDTAQMNNGQTPKVIDIVYGNGYFVALLDGRLYYSSDGASWKFYQDLGDDEWRLLGYGNNSFPLFKKGSVRMLYVK